MPQGVILQSRGNELPSFFGKLISTFHSYKPTAICSLPCIVIFLFRLYYLLSSFLFLPRPLLISFIHGNGLYGIGILGMVVVIATLLSNNKLSIGINGAIAFNYAYLIHDMRCMCCMRGLYLFLDISEVFMLRDVVAGFTSLFMHVDAVQVNRLHLLLRTNELPLALALHPILIVVFVGRRFHLFAASCRFLRSAYSTKQRIGIGG